MNPPPSTSPASRPEGATVAAVTVLTSRGVRELRPADALRSYDFRQSGFLAPSELRVDRDVLDRVRAIGHSSSVRGSQAMSPNRTILNPGSFSILTSS